EPGYFRARRAAKLGIAVTGSLAAVEAVLGLTFGSIAIVADATHAAIDMASTVVVLLGLIYAARPPDSVHPYGHAKLEMLTSLGVGLMLLLSAFLIGYEAVDRLISPREMRFSFALLGVAGAAAVVNLFLARYKMRVGKESHCPSLVADGHHSESDLWASVAVIVGLTAVVFNFPMGDALAALAVVGFIVMTAGKIFRGAYPALLDASPGDDYLKELSRLACCVDGVVACHAVRARTDGRCIHVDMHIEVTEGTRIEDAHAVTHAVERRIREEISGIGTVLIHTEPPLDKEPERTRRATVADRR
ncbi:MAG: cation diffusion facilitator family transporter, partial [Candidatus Bathyarchaeia archaeon]